MHLITQDGRYPLPPTILQKYLKKNGIRKGEIKKIINQPEREDKKPWKSEVNENT